MEKYELRKENSYGNQKIAVFEELDVLIKHTVDNPLKKGFRYYVIIIKTEEIRHDLSMIIKILEAGNRHLL
ncbi:MAG: hypothetical protein KAS66_15295 [Candidatus Omnitrophica bacterium]|nr:hypothetical protein [Candidatus Omnitrophota bacterium]